MAWRLHLGGLQDFEPEGQELVNLVNNVPPTSLLIILSFNWNDIPLNASQSLPDHKQNHVLRSKNQIGQ
jgi:hypothetical protein